MSPSVIMGETERKGVVCGERHLGFVKPAREGYLESPVLKLQGWSCRGRVKVDFDDKGVRR